MMLTLGDLPTLSAIYIVFVIAQLLAMLLTLLKYQLICQL